MPNPYSSNRMQAWVCDPMIAAGNATPGAGVLQLARIDIGPNQPVYCTNIVLVVTTGGSGATSLANCFAGLYDSTGTFLANSGTADQSSGGSNWSTSGVKSMAMTSTQLLQPNKSYWVGVVVGTQSTTNLVFASAGSASLNNLNIAPSLNRNGTILSGQTSLPSSFTPGSVSLAKTHWAAVS